MSDIPAHLQPKYYDLKCQCLQCGKIYHTKISERTNSEILNGRRQEPPCPKKACREKLKADEIKRMAENMASIIVQQRAPGHTGSNTAKAIDTTADMVMQDYGMSNLRDDSREGESSVQKLPPAQQERADSFFAPPRGVMNPVMQMQMQRASMMAMGGALQPRPGSDEAVVDRVLGAKHRVPYKVINKGG